MQVEFRRLFLRDLHAVKDRKLRQRIEAIVMELEGASSFSELRNIKAIQGNPNFYRLKVGDYRLGIYVKDNVVALVQVLHRKEIYRYFP
ncbi:MAG: type II toxin-antitoxin system RelE/ParE family toxin [Cyanobacteria bacterium RI_101]|nr:type II toxin-antitoxin system RelE/ParE family toxin [Cyanobacteria bacterium RI_101]